jgi:ankyrin repeat protein
MTTRSTSLLTIAGAIMLASALALFFAIANVRKPSSPAAPPQGTLATNDAKKLVSAPGTSAAIVEAALRSGDMERVSRELDGLRAPNKRLDDLGTTALQLAARSNNAEAIRLLLRSGADANLPDSQGKTPLMLAAEHADAAIVLALLDSGANPNVQDRDARIAGDRAATRTDAEGRQIAQILAHAGR